MRCLGLSSRSLGSCRLLLRLRHLRLLGLQLRLKRRLLLLLLRLESGLLGGNSRLLRSLRIGFCALLLLLRLRRLLGLLLLLLLLLLRLLLRDSCLQGGHGRITGCNARS